MLSLYRRALALRRELAGWLEPAFVWLDTPPGVHGLRAWGLGCDVSVNLSDAEFPFGDLGDVLLGSSPLDRRIAVLPTDCAVWLQSDR